MTDIDLLYLVCDAGFVAIGVVLGVMGTRVWPALRYRWARRQIASAMHNRVPSVPIAPVRVDIRDTVASGKVVTFPRSSPGGESPKGGPRAA